MYSYLRDDLRAGLSFIRYSDRFVTTVVTGALLLNFGYLILPVVLLMGYFVVVVQSSVDERGRPPRFRNWGTLLVDGSKAAVLAFVYVNFTFVIVGSVASQFGVPLSAILGYLEGLQWVVLQAGRRALGRSSVEVLLTSRAAASFSWVLAALYIFPAAFAQFSVSERRHVRDGLKVESLLAVLVSRRYLSAWLVGFGFLLAGVITVLVPTWLPMELLGVRTYGASPLSLAAIFSYNVLQLLGYAIFFALQVAAYRLVGRAWRDIYPDQRPYQSRTAYKRRVNHTLDRWSDERSSDREPGDRTAAIPDSVTYARRNFENRRTALIGGSTVLLGDLLLPMVLVGGYLARVLRRTAAAPEPPDATEPPGFERWRLLVSDGGRMLLVWVAYVALPVAAVAYGVRRFQLPTDAIAVLGSVFGGLAIVPLRVILTGFLNAVPSAGPPGRLAGPAASGIGGGPVDLLYWLVVVFGLTLPLVYVLPAGLVNCARTRSIRAGLRLRMLVASVTNPTYARAWGRAVVVAVVGWLPIVALLVALPDDASTPVATLRGGEFRETISLAILPLQSIRDPTAPFVHGLLLVGGVVFFYAQIASFFLVGRASRRTLPAIGATGSLGSEQDGGSQPNWRTGRNWMAVAGWAGVIGGGLLGLLAAGLFLDAEFWLASLLFILIFFVGVATQPVAVVGMLFCAAGHYIRARRESRFLESGILGVTVYLLTVLCVSSAWFIFALITHWSFNQKFANFYLDLLFVLLPYSSILLASLVLRRGWQRPVGLGIVVFIVATIVPVHLFKFFDLFEIGQARVVFLTQFSTVPLGLCWIALGYALVRGARS